jgi:HlyD family secretion protein
VKNRRRRPVVAALAVGVLGLLACGVGSSLSAGDLSDPTEEDRGAAAAPMDGVGLDVVEPVAEAGAVGGAGLVEPLDRPTSLSVEVSGLVASVEVTEGQRVAAGDVLIRLSAGVAEADRDGAGADERAARADREAAAADARAAAARAAASEDIRRRAVALAERDAGTADERDRAVRIAEADVEAARAADARVGQAQARVAAASARLAQAERRLEQLVVRAPADGEVLQILVRPGEFLAPGGVAAVVGDTRGLRARLDIDERDVSRVAVGQPARVRIEGLPGEFTGRVAEIGRRVGRKNVRTDDPTDRQDARFVEVVVTLDATPAVPIGVRVEGTIDATPSS